MPDAARPPTVSPGDLTLAGYEQAAQRYRDRTGAVPPPELARFLDELAMATGPGGHCLEIGSGTGRDARELEHRGLVVERTDATRAFLEMMRGDGYAARRLDVRTDELGGPYDAVLADAVLLHLTRTEFAAALLRIRSAVRPGGVLALTLKEGDGERWSDAKLGVPRFFTYWREPALRRELAAAGWRVVSLEQVAGRNDDWLYVLSRPS